MHTLSHDASLQRQVRAGEGRPGRASVVGFDGLDGGGKAGTQHPETDAEDDHVEDGVCRSEWAVEVFALVQSPVGNGPEDEAKEGVKEGCQEGQEVAHAGNDFSKDEAHKPDNGGDQDPWSPALNRVAVLVWRLSHHTTVDVLAGDVAVDCTDDDRGHNDKSERGLLVDDLQGAESWRRGVLAEEFEANGGRNDEENERGDGQGPESLWEVLGIAHLCDKRREEQLWYKEETDVQDGVEDLNPRCAGQRAAVGLDWAVNWVRAVVSERWVVFDAGKDEEEEDGNGHADG